MQELARDVYLLPGKPKHVINIYLVDNVLVDAGTPASAKRIFRGMGNGAPSSHLVTHAHPDHFGSSAEVCKHYDIPLICGERDAGNIETGRPETSDTALGRNFLSKLPPLPGHPVATRLREGDRVGTFEVFDVPGHSRGHIALWRAEDRTLVIGDVVWNLNIVTFQTGLREPPRSLTIDPAQNRESARKMAALKPELVLFGHGPPLRNSELFTWFVAGLAG